MFGVGLSGPDQTDITLLTGCWLPVPSILFTRKCWMFMLWAEIMSLTVITTHHQKLTEKQMHPLVVLMK